MSKDVEERFDDLAKVVAERGHTRGGVIKVGLGLLGAGVAGSLTGRASADEPKPPKTVCAKPAKGETCTGPDTCGGQTSCSDTGCFCVTKLNGKCFCHQPIICGTTATCTTSDDCPEGWACAYSCCEGTVCLPPCGTSVAAPTALAGGRTSAG